MRYLLLAAFMTMASPVVGDETDVRAIVETHVLPRYEILSAETATLAETAAEDCSPDSPKLIAAYHNAFDAWVGVSHLRFGPSEQDDRAFALAFWPDPRGSTPKALSGLLRQEDPAVHENEEFSKVSIAARGLYALEFLLFATQFSETEKTGYRCTLIQAVATDIAHNSAAILAGWEDGYGDLMSNPGNDIYRTSTEAAQQVFTALTTGLEFTSQVRLGRPLGTFERPRPNRAEAWRSGRSLRHVILSLAAARELAALITTENEDVDRSFEAALQKADDLGDPVFAGVADPQGRFQTEVLQQSVDAIRRILAKDVGPSLGIAAGFNALDGD